MMNDDDDFRLARIFKW